MAKRGTLDDNTVWRVEEIKKIPNSDEARKLLLRVKEHADNVLKAVKDGMNGIVWVDDAQAVEYRISKRYSTAPGVCVSVEQLPLQAA